MSEFICMVHHLVKRIQFTKDGLEKVKQEHAVMTAKRPEAIARLRTAREQGDLSENGAYKAARFEVNDIDRRLRHLNKLLLLGQVYESKNTGMVDLGATVTVDDGKKQYTYTIVGGYESNPVEGKLSTYSPIGKALMGKKIGDRVDVTIPKGTVQYTITQITS